MFWREKSRQQWLAEGDRNTSYFHAMCRVRKAQSSITLLREGSQVFEDCASIQNHILDYYTNIFAKDKGCHDTGLVSRVIPSLVIEEENNRLIEVPSSDEIWSAIKSMDPDSAPGPDGFNGHFFVSCWDIVGRDVVAAVQYFFRTGKLPSSFNSSIIILIPKVEHADCIKNFRPIALANFIFKIIPKIISLRLTDIASRIISPQQHAFVKGRNISDCIMTTSECFNLLDNKCYGGNVAIKVDITKAFDTLSWDFLAHVLQTFGFHHVFVTWVRNLLHSAKLSLQINGSGSPNSVLLMLNLGLSSSRSPQLRELWSTCFVTTIWFIWSSRNKIKYEGLRVDATRVCSLISGHAISSSKLATGCMFNSSEELVVLKKLAFNVGPGVLQE
ncbi:hypothetical protein ACLB2K_003686 [Fragaria x ananassa]